METRFKIAAFIMCWLSATQLANACRANNLLTKMDVAFAGAIFEGHIWEVQPDSKGRSSELLFDVLNVVRGDLPEKQIAVFLTGGSAYSAPQSREEFIKHYGEKTRIALTTPKQVEMFCRNEIVSSVTGAGVRSEKFLYKCDYPILNRSPKAKDIPVVLRRWCGAPYLFKVNSYEKMRNYNANVEKFNQQPHNLQTAEFFKEITGGVGPLPWNYFHPRYSQNIAIELYRDYGYLFTSRLKEDDDAQDILLSRGIDMIKADKTYFSNSPQRKKHLESFRKTLKYEVLQVATIVERDPEFGERLLVAE